MMSRLVTWTFMVCLISFNSHAELGLLSEQLNNSEMKKLLGHWHIEDSSMNVEGQWQQGAGASWHFYPILNGHAVQDDWIAPPLNQPEPEGGRQFGTNIRIYNPNENRWEMAWASIKGQKVDTFNAIEADGKIIMTGDFNGRPSRITFYDIQTNSFSWKLEFQQADDTNAWTEVYRIKGKRSVKSS
ncbi:MAG: hypothetical protein ACSHWU_08740 [Marinicella sp.]